MKLNCVYRSCHSVSRENVRGGSIIVRWKKIFCFNLNLVYNRKEDFSLFLISKIPLLSDSSSTCIIYLYFSVSFFKRIVKQTLANIETSRIVPCIETLFSNIVSSRETRDSREIAKISREIVEKFRDASSASSEADLTGIERCGGGRWRVNREGAPFGRERRGPVCRSDAAVMSTNIYLIGSAAARRRTLPLCYAGAISIPSSPSASERGTTVPSLSPTQYYLRTCLSVRWQSDRL